MRGAQNLPHAKLFQITLAFPQVEHHTRTENRRVHTHHDSQNQCHSKATHLVGADGVENDGSDQRCDIGIHNRRGGPRKTIADRQPQGSPFLQLFPDALEDQHIGINRHTDREHQACQSGQRHRRLQQNHQGQDEQQVQE